MEDSHLPSKIDFIGIKTAKIYVTRPTISSPIVRILPNDKSE